MLLFCLEKIWEFLVSPKVSNINPKGFLYKRIYIE